MTIFDSIKGFSMIPFGYTFVLCPVWNPVFTGITMSPIDCHSLESGNSETINPNVAKLC